MLVPPAAFATEVQACNARLADVGESRLLEGEFIAARLYTGPMYVKYTRVLRSATKEVAFLVEQCEELCGRNRYTTTLNVINSTVMKLGKLIPAQKVYRGVSVLGAERAERARRRRAVHVDDDVADVALQYAARGSGLVLEVQMGMIDRGADLSSQYPHEKEILLAPLTGLEVQGLRTEGEIVIAEMRLSVNFTSPPIEQSVAKLKFSHLSSQMLLTELQGAGAPEQALEGIVALREEATARSGGYFNDLSTLKNLTNEALEAGDTLGTLAAAETWENVAGSKEEVRLRMRTCAELCALKNASHDAIALLRLCLDLVPDDVQARDLEAVKYGDDRRASREHCSRPALAPSRREAPARPRRSAALAVDPRCRRDGQRRRGGDSRGRGTRGGARPDAEPIERSRESPSRHARAPKPQAAARIVVRAAAIASMPTAPTSPSARAESVARPRSASPPPPWPPPPRHHLQPRLRRKSRCAFGGGGGGGATGARAPARSAGRPRRPAPRAAPAGVQGV